MARPKEVCCVWSCLDPEEAADDASFRANAEMLPLETSREAATREGDACRATTCPRERCMSALDCTLPIVTGPMNPATSHTRRHRVALRALNRAGPTLVFFEFFPAKLHTVSVARTFLRGAPRGTRRSHTPPLTRACHQHTTIFAIQLHGRRSPPQSAHLDVEPVHARTQP